MPYDELEERLQDIVSRLGEVERGPYPCPECGRVWVSWISAKACCDDDSGYNQP